MKTETRETNAPIGQLKAISSWVSSVQDLDKLLQLIRQVPGYFYGIVTLANQRYILQLGFIEIGCHYYPNEVRI